MAISNRILIIEDDDDARKLIRVTLENGVRIIVESATVEEGMDLIDSLRFDIMLIDIGLSSGATNGLAIAKQVLAHPMQRLCQVAIVTGSDAPEHIALAQELGVAAYLIKPFSPGKLSAIVAKMESRLTDTLIVPPTRQPDAPNTFGELRMTWPTLFF